MCAILFVSWCIVLWLYSVDSFSLVCRYADTLVGTKGFYEHGDNVEVVVRLLQAFQRCRKKHPETAASSALPDEETSQKLVQKFEAVLCTLRGNCSAAEEKYRSMYFNQQQGQPQDDSNDD